MNNLRSERKKKRRLRKGVKAFLWFTGILTLAILAYSGYLYFKVNSMLSDSFFDDGREKSALRDAPVDPVKDNISILIIGADTSDVRESKGNARSDTLILATLNKKDNSIKLVSIPRDTYTYIPDLGYETKINHAYAKGGVLSTIEAVESLMEVPVDFYVTLNFEAFIEIVDTLGGITVDVPYEIHEMDSTDKKNAIHLLPGLQKLNGEEALALARTRKYDNDIERGKRQQEIIKAIVEKAISVNSFTKYDDIIETVGDNMKTNLTTGQIAGLIKYSLGEKDLDIDTHTLIGYDYQPGSTYYYKLDEIELENTKELLQNHLGINIQTTPYTAEEPDFEPGLEEETANVIKYNH